MKLLALLQVAGNPVNGEAWSTRLGISSMWVPDYWLICFGTTYKKPDFSPPGVFNIGGQRRGPKRNGFPIKALNCSNVFNDYLWAERKGLKLKPTEKFPRFLLANAACLPDVRLHDVRKVLPNSPKGLDPTYVAFLNMLKQQRALRFRSESSAHG